jgi:hypothetical protein
MATTWTISTLERDLSDGGVVVAHWRCSGSETSGEDTFNASVYSTCGFTPDPSASDFVPYDSLTEDTVLGWVWGQVDKNATEAAVTAKINAQMNPTTGAGVPW